MMQAAQEYLQSYRPKHWGINLEHVYGFIEECLTIFPENIDRLPFEMIETLPKLPQLVLYLED